MNYEQANNPNGHEFGKEAKEYISKLPSFLQQVAWGAFLTGASTGAKKYKNATAATSITVGNINYTTEEQIKQNAEEYAKKIYPYTAGKAAAIRYFIAGAHSRDEEIKELKEEIESLQEQYNTCFDGFTKRGTKLGELMRENVKLRNPWISVEDMLPEEHSRVLIMFCNGTVTYNDYIGVGDINYMKAHPEIITHWMPIPQIKKEEK